MPVSKRTVDVYLEIGTNRAFAGALDWPGWCRSGKGDQEALQALVDYGPRYAKVARRGRLRFEPPSDISGLRVVERLKGDATTDFGAPGKTPSADGRRVTPAQTKRLQTVLRACWATFDASTEAAANVELRKGPRGGGRDLDQIVRHVLEADAGYLSRLGAKYPIGRAVDPAEQLAPIRKVILRTLVDAASGDPVRRGPRGGVRWTPRYHVRRCAWHVLDHAWEIEDRATPA